MPGKALNSQVVVGATRTKVLDENPNRTWACFVNDSNEDISLLMSDNGVDGGGIVLKANGGLYEINMWNFWDGYVYAICASGAKTLSFVEVTNYARF